jgi:hypothetical protein
VIQTGLRRVSGEASFSRWLVPTGESGWAVLLISSPGAATTGGRRRSFHAQQERAPMRLPIMFAVAALALAGCNANAPPDGSTRSARFAVSSVQDPIHQAQTSGFYAGR